MPLCGFCHDKKGDTATINGICTVILAHEYITVKHIKDCFTYFFTQNPKIVWISREIRVFHGVLGTLV